MPGETPASWRAPRPAGEGMNPQPAFVCSICDEASAQSCAAVHQGHLPESSARQCGRCSRLLRVQTYGSSRKARGWDEQAHSLPARPPDDAEILAAGTLALLAARGHRSTVVSMTAGDCGTDIHSPQEIADIRRTEAAAPLPRSGPNTTASVSGSWHLRRRRLAPQGDGHAAPPPPRYRAHGLAGRLPLRSRGDFETGRRRLFRRSAPNYGTAAFDPDSGPAPHSSPLLRGSRRRRRSRRQHPAAALRGEHRIRPGNQAADAEPATKASARGCSGSTASTISSTRGRPGAPARGPRRFRIRRRIPPLHRPPLAARIRCSNRCLPAKAGSPSELRDAKTATKRTGKVRLVVIFYVLFQRFASKHQADVHDVGAGRAGLDEVAQGGEEVVAVVAARAAAGLRPRARARWTVAPSAIAPAASVGPSVPSVPPLKATTLAEPARSMAAARANSWLRPPRP